jgi:hypothetical protein
MFLPHNKAEWITCIALSIAAFIMIFRSMGGKFGIWLIYACAGVSSLPPLPAYT